MSERFMGKVVIVTGSGSGLGRASALRFAAEGARVVIADIDAASGRSTAESARDLGASAIAVKVDVAEESDISALMSLVVNEFGRIDVLLNNAAAFGDDALGLDNDLTQMSVDAWDRTFAVNMRGTMLGCKHAVPVMISQGGGVITNMSSRSSLLGDTRASAYGSSKGAINSFTRYVATMYGAWNIRCNAIVPASVEPCDKDERYTPVDRALRRAERLLPNAPGPTDVATLAAFLSSNEAACITGQTVVIDGGVTAHRPRHAIESWTTAVGDG